MTYQVYRARRHELTKREMNALTHELDTIEANPTDDELWLDWADCRLTEIIAILEDSYRLARVRELGLRIIQGGPDS